ncbi:MAG: glycosyltransferase family 2 protein [Candidatus Magasanikbacteria bacterium]|jgi:glycosyltransferase involved in cell wall biosynthesis
MILVVVPAHNEAKQIGRVVRGLFEHGWKDIVVIDDGSTDDTAGEATRAGAKVLTHVINRGQGAALQTGDEYARAIGAEIVVHFDGDDQMNPGDIGPAIDVLKNNSADVLVGSRFLDVRSRLPWSKKYLLLPISRLINYLFTGVWMSDAHNGFRILNSRALAVITIRQDGMAHNTEIICQVKKHHLKLIEFPVEVRYHEYGQGIGGGVRIITDLIKELMMR